MEALKELNEELSNPSEAKLLAAVDTRERLLVDVPACEAGARDRLDELICVTVFGLCLAFTQEGVARGITRPPGPVCGTQSRRQREHMLWLVPSAVPLRRKKSAQLPGPECEAANCTPSAPSL